MLQGVATQVFRFLILVASATLLDFFFLSHTVLMMRFCRAHTVVNTIFSLGILLGGCRLDVDLELVFVLEQN